MLRIPLLLLSLAACSEYELNPDDDNLEPVTCPQLVFPEEHLAIANSCAATGSPGTFTPVTEWTLQTFVEQPTSNNVMMTPIVAQVSDDDNDGDIDADDVPDILFVTYVGTSYTANGTLRAVAGDGSGVVYTAAAGELGGSSGLAAGDIDGDGLVEIIATTSSYTIRAFEHDGTPKWTSATFAYNDVGYSGRMPAISDMDGDGSPEIILGRVILNADGTTRGVGLYGVGATNYGASSFAVDLDRDGTQEVVVGNALYDPDGNAIWSNGEQDGFVAVADFDGDGQGEIVVSGYGAVRLQDTDGTILWSTSVSGTTYGNGGPPTVADFDGDGAPEVGLAGRDAYTVIDTDGTTLWSMITQDGSSGATGSSVFDFEGDGVAEAIYADEVRIWAYNGPDGQIRLESEDHTSWTVAEYPVIADVDGDDEAEIVVANSQHPSLGVVHHGITVIGDADHSWRPGRKIWNQHAYHITNVNDDGTIPTDAPLNWDTYNSFRSGDLTPERGPNLPDLVVRVDEVCDVDCSGGRLRVWARVGNRGATDVPAGTTLGLWVETPSGEQQVAFHLVEQPVRFGVLQEAVLLEADGVDLYDVTRVWVEATAPGALEECVGDNNVAEWTEPLCY